MNKVKYKTKVGKDNIFAFMYIIIAVNLNLVQNCLMYNTYSFYTNINIAKFIGNLYYTAFSQ